jgi:hypothetical protein
MSAALLWSGIVTMIAIVYLHAFDASGPADPALRQPPAFSTLSSPSV